MIKKRKLSRVVKKIKINEKCPFCQGKSRPDYKEVEILKKFITERGKIIGRDYGGTCASHQRQLTKEIKRARHLALLPFINQIR